MCLKKSGNITGNFLGQNMNIERKTYLNRLISRRENGMIKVVTGMRRCGKSYLLRNLFVQYLTNDGVSAERITYINLEDYANRTLRDADALYAHIKNKMHPSEMNYIILDEIQMAEGFVDILNGLLNTGNADVYVTGSNAKFLSKDIITEFRGRGDEVNIYPLSFKEYMSVCEGNYTKAFDEFLLFGSLPQILQKKDEEQKMSFLKTLFAETYLRDIKERYDIQDDADLEELISIVASSVGALTNPLNISNAYETTKRIKLNYQTIKTYLEYLTDSFLIEQSKRYDIKGKKYISTPYKYYFSDLGLRNARLNFSQNDHGHLMENAIYNELRIRGFNVDVGVVTTRNKNANGEFVRSNLEVDFVCNKGNKRYYIQSAYRMPDNAKEAQEMASLQKTNDFFKKIIVVGDDIHIRRDASGITIMSVYDFLLNENSLDS